jgi:uncharacterized protein (DUF362 family)
MAKSVIGTARSEYHDIYSKLGKGLALIGDLKLAHNDTVIIKLNLCDARTPETGAITHPLFLDGVLRYLRENYESLRIYVVESDATVALADEFVQWLGFVPILKKWGAEFVNLSKIRAVNRRVNGRYFKEVPVPAIFEQPHFFITVPKPKTNPISTITCCLKNQFGCLPVVEKNIYHPHLDDVIADVNKAIPIDLCLVDGIIAQGGAQGPAFGVPIPLDTLIVSRDPVATDAFCAKLMGFRPWFIGHIRKSASSGVGSMKYIVKGDKVDKLDFEVSRLEFWLIRFGSSLQRRAQVRFRTAGGPK